MAAMIGLRFTMENMNKKNIEARIIELEKTEPNQQQL